MGGKNHRGGRALNSQLLDHQGIADVIEAGAAVLLGNEDTHHAEPAQFGDRLGGKAMVAVGFDPDGGQTLACETARRITRRALSFAEFQIHHSRSRSIRTTYKTTCTTARKTTRAMPGKTIRESAAAVVTSRGA